LPPEIDEHVEKPVGKGYSGYYLKKRAHFTKRGLTKRIILHELYHHLIDIKGLEVPIEKRKKMLISMLENSVLIKARADCEPQIYYIRTQYEMMNRMNINTKIQEFLKHLASNGHKERLQLVLTIIKSQFTDGFLS
jgi:hypothetical protein